jgi:DNA-binding CsgD family transcriptional regulator
MAQELSNREWEVVKLLQEGKSNKLIASSLHISERTVEFHLKNIYAKFQVSSRIELILQLGDSTVAGRVEIPENRDRFNFWNWAASLKDAFSRKGKEFRMENLMDSSTRNEANQMTFFESIRECLKKYADFKGRASRPEFWWFTLFVILVASALVYLNENLASVFLIAVLLPWLAAGSRRLHDTGKSAWWQLYLLIPVGGIIWVGVLWAQPPTSPPPDDAPVGT